MQSPFDASELAGCLSDVAKTNADFWTRCSNLPVRPRQITPAGITSPVALTSNLPLLPTPKPLQAKRPRDTVMDLHKGQRAVVLNLPHDTLCEDLTRLFDPYSVYVHRVFRNIWLKSVVNISIYSLTRLETLSWVLPLLKRQPELFENCPENYLKDLRSHCLPRSASRESALSENSSHSQRGRWHSMKTGRLSESGLIRKRLQSLDSMPSRHTALNPKQRKRPKH